MFSGTEQALGKEGDDGFGDFGLKSFGQLSAPPIFMGVCAVPRVGEQGSGSCACLEMFHCSVDQFVCGERSI